VDKPKFTFTFNPGKYQWRMRAENNASVTDYSEIRTITIDSTETLAQANMVLSLPADNYITNNPSVSFSWNKLYSAEDYRFQLINTQNSNTIIDIISTGDSCHYTLAEGQYNWQVRAQNASSNSSYTSRNLIIDLTAPIVSVQSSPLNNAIITNPASLAWARDVSASWDSLFIYPDSLVSAAVYREYTSSTSYNYSGVSGQWYFWRVRSKDTAGNWSGYSTLRKFKIQ
jgi:hypothetical protein